MPAKTSLLTKKNKIAQGEINTFSSFNISGYVPFRDFATYTESDFLNRKIIIRIVLSRSELVENDTSLAYIGNFGFGGNFGRKKREKSYARFLIEPEVTDRFC